MTSSTEGGQYASSKRDKEPGDSSSTGIPAKRRGITGESTDIYQREQAEGIQTGGKGRGVAELGELQSRDVQGDSPESDGNGDMGERGMEPGHQAGHTGERERLRKVKL